MHIVNVADLIEANHRTWRQNNMERGHAIPIGTLVEVDMDYSELHGIRMYVCEHTRDCNGTPLYALYHGRNMDSLFYVKTENPNLYRFMITDGYSDDCLTVVKPLEPAYPQCSLMKDF